MYARDSLWLCGMVSYITLCHFLPFCLWFNVNVIWKLWITCWPSTSLRKPGSSSLIRITSRHILTWHKSTRSVTNGQNITSKVCFVQKKTSTQRSESANHMLKNYVPSGCPMHILMRKYMLLQFDREAEENYEEKQTRIGRPLLRANMATERHANKIYTWAMFKQFGIEFTSVVLTRWKRLGKGSYMSQSIRMHVAERSGAGFRTRWRCWTVKRNLIMNVASFLTWDCCAATLWRLLTLSKQQKYQRNT